MNQQLDELIPENDRPHTSGLAGTEILLVEQSDYVGSQKVLAIEVWQCF